MTIRFSEGQHILVSAATVAGKEGFERLAVEGALLALDFSGLNIAEITAAEADLLGHLSEEISEADDTIRGGLVGLVGAIERGANLAKASWRNKNEEAMVVDTGSQPTSTGDVATSNAPTQSSVEADEEDDNEQSQPQQEPQQPARRKRG
jgi:hypothetical protein